MGEELPNVVGPDGIIRPTNERVCKDYEEELQRKLDNGGRGLTDYDIEQIVDHGDHKLNNQLNRIADERQLQKRYYERANGVEITGFNEKGEAYQDIQLDFSNFTNQHRR